MKVLVTGATSGLGRNASQWLQEAGYDVLALGRDERAGEELRELGMTFIAIELTTATDETLLQLVTGCDAVWHCAAKSSPWGQAESFFCNNVVVTQNLAKAAGLAGIKRFVHISSPAVYFDFCHHYNLPETYRAKRFSSHYASSKYAAEQAVEEAVLLYPDTTFVILRPRGIFGPHDRTIFPRLLQQLSGNRNLLRLPGGGEALLDLTFVLNVVHAMWLATDRKDLRSGAIYNITNQQPQRLIVVVDELLGRQLNYKFSVRAVPYWLLSVVSAGMELVAKLTGKEPMLTRYSVGAAYFDMTLDSQRASEELGYHPRYSLEEGIVLTGNWIKNQGNSHHG